MPLECHHSFYIECKLDVTTQYIECLLGVNLLNAALLKCGLDIELLNATLNVKHYVFLKAK